MSKRVLPEAEVVKAMLSVSPGPTGLRNLAELIWQGVIVSFPSPDAGGRSACNTVCTAASSNTTPGTIGVPGKWPAKAGWSGAIRSVVSACMGGAFALMRLCQRQECVARQFAGAVARQRIQQHQRSWHENGVDTLPQGRQQSGRLHTGCDGKGHQAGHAVAIVICLIGHEKRAVDHTRHGIELVVQVVERAAFTRDVDEVGSAAVQQKMPGSYQFKLIGHGCGLLDMPTRGPHAPLRG